MAHRRVCSDAPFLTLALLVAPATALAQQPAVTITSAPSFAARHSSYTIAVTSTAAPFTSATFTLSANFPDVSFSESSWSHACAFTSCGSTRIITVFTGNSGGANATVTATGRNGALTAVASANTWIRGASHVVAPSATMPTLGTRVVNLVLQTAPPLGVTYQLALSGPAAAGSSVPPTVTIPPGVTSVPFTLNTGTNPGNLAISATTGSPYYAAPVAAAIQVLAPDSVPTPVGNNVRVSPPVPGGGVAVTSTFERVVSAGFTRVTNVSEPLPPPSGYEAPGAPLYFALSTTAQVEGAMTVCASYAGAQTADPTELRLFRILPPAAWTNQTESVDSTARQVCGVIDAAAANSAAQWAIFRLNSAPVVGAINGPPGIIAAGENQAFSATFTDADPADTHTGIWMWGDGSTSPAAIAHVDGVWTATGEHAFGPGTHQAHLVITDGGQPAASRAIQVIADGAAPAIASLTATPGSLWQPDGRMHTVTLAIAASDDTGVPACQVTDVTATARNIRQTAYAITGPMEVQLKAFPQATYSVTVTCTDAVQRTARRSVTISVERGPSASRLSPAVRSAHRTAASPTQ